MLEHITHRAQGQPLSQRMAGFSRQQTHLALSSMCFVSSTSHAGFHPQPPNGFTVYSNNACCVLSEMLFIGACMLPVKGLAPEVQQNPIPSLCRLLSTRLSLAFADLAPRRLLSTRPAGPGIRGVGNHGRTTSGFLDTVPCMRAVPIGPPRPAYRMTQPPPLFFFLPGGPCARLLFLISRTSLKNVSSFTMRAGRAAVNQWAVRNGNSGGYPISHTHKHIHTHTPTKTS